MKYMFNQIEGDRQNIGSKTEIRRGADKSLAFEKNLVSSRQCCSSQGGHYAPEIGRSSLRSSETPGLLT
jgi:hypothetical protein